MKAPGQLRQASRLGRSLRIDRGKRAPRSIHYAGSNLPCEPPDRPANGRPRPALCASQMSGILWLPLHVVLHTATSAKDTSEDAKT